MSQPKKSAKKKPGKPAKKEDERAASPRSPHRLRGGILFGVGTLATLLMMANGEQLPHGPLFGIITMLVAAFGLVDLLGLFAEKAEDAPPVADTVFGRLEGEPAWAEPRYTATVAICILIAGAILGGYDGLPYAVLAACAALLPSAVRRPGLLVFAVVTAIYLPLLGTYGLWDPWETHYGEVSREILARDDWISLWWAQENWFWSKPILIFWSEALTMGAMGVEFQPDANPAHPEWAVRLPIFLISLGAVMSMYAAIGRLFGKRAGVLAALVLASVPHFFFLAHQAITDMPFVGNMTIAIAMLVLALCEDPDREVRRYRLGKLTLSARHVMMFVLVLVALPQALYLISRNVTMVDPFVFAWHGDQFMYGSAGNLGVPGNPAVRDMGPHVTWLQPGLQAVIWLAGLAGLVWMVKRERRAQALYMYAFYLFCAFAFLGKGIGGFGLPGLISLLYLIASKRWNLLFEGRLRIGTGALIIAVVGLPWYVAMYVRHGPGFTDRLLIHDHVNRLASGVHGDEGSIAYFMEQLGYATFPWVALVPAAVLGWLWWRRTRLPGASGVPQPSVGALAATADPAWASDDDGELERHRRETLTLIAVWFFTAFALFSAMITKFHHYIFPAVPPAALLVGVLLDRMFGPRPDGGDWRRMAGTVLAVVAPVAIVLGVAGLYGDVRGVIPEGVPADDRDSWVLDHPWNAYLSRALVMGGALLVVAAGWLLRESANGSREGGGPYRGSKARTDRYTPPSPLEIRILGGLVAASALLGVVIGNTLLAVAAALLLAVVFRVAQRPSKESVLGRFEGATLGATVAAGAVLGAFVGRDLSWETAARPQGYERLIHLFVYNYDRKWPDQLDYRPILTAFAIVTTVFLGVAVFRRMRPLASRALLGAALCFATWATNVYLIDLSPHWTQRGLVKKYYELRSGPEQPLVAWQMNWKGENFYTGNRVSVFVDLDNEEIRQWLDEKRGETAYFIFEHTRFGSFRNLM
ncbi:MAG: ArnT family glycosyltransferase, partial [Polyangiales bacterium]